MLRKFAASSVLLAAVPVAPTKDTKDSSAETKKRPQDLPIYSTIHDSSEKTSEEKPAESSTIRSGIECGVRTVRETCCDCASSIQAQKKPIDDFVSKGIEHSQFVFDYLNEPANGPYRAGAIAVGALSGYIIGIRRGFIRRLLYTSIGGLGVASICYPKEAEQYSQQALSEAKTYATILYNFAYGVKPGDEPKPIPSVSSSLSNAYESVAKWFGAGKKPEK